MRGRGQAIDRFIFSFTIGLRYEKSRLCRVNYEAIFLEAAEKLAIAASLRKETVFPIQSTAA